MNDNVVDVPAFKNYCNDDMVLIGDLAIIFAKQVTDISSRIRIAIEEHNVADLSESAHRLMGTLRYLFCPSLVAIAEQLERDGESLSQTEAEALLKQLDSGNRCLLDELSTLTGLELVTEV